MNKAKLAATVVSAGVSFLIPRVVDGTWKLITGDNPPDTEEKGKLTQVLLYAAISAVIVTAVERGAMLLLDSFEKEEPARIEA